MKDKKAVSVIIGYVMLISMAIALSILVFAWLRFYVSPGEELECPSDVALVIQDYYYDGETLGLRLKNKGLFSIDGYFVRASNRSDAEVSSFLLEQVEALSVQGQERQSILKPNQVVERDFEKKDSEDNEILGDFTFVEVLPYIYEDGNRLICGSVSRSIIQKDFAGSSGSSSGDSSGDDGSDGSSDDGSSDDGDVSCSGDNDCGPGQVCTDSVCVDLPSCTGELFINCNFNNQEECCDGNELSGEGVCQNNEYTCIWDDSKSSCEVSWVDYSGETEEDCGYTCNFINGNEVCYQDSLQGGGDDPVYCEVGVLNQCQH